MKLKLPSPGWPGPGTVLKAEPQRCPGTEMEGRGGAPGYSHWPAGGQESLG